jgi:NitT/TauT family transport system ATP-binding protein
MALIRLQDVGKVYANGTVALEHCSLALQAGEFVSFLGPSGCGKSTALRLIAGLTIPSSGTILGDGIKSNDIITSGGVSSSDGAKRANQVASSTGAARDQIGFVFQEPTLMPWASVADNVRLPLRIADRSATETRDRVAQALAMVGLSDFAQVYPRELSGGMKMRVSIARALVTRPKLLLMDEPFAALDEMTRIKLNNDVLRLWRQHQFTVVFVTHSVYESVYLSSRILVMAARPGRIIDDIAIDEPYPRDEDFRTSARYGEICRSVSRSLRQDEVNLGRP